MLGAVEGATVLVLAPPRDWLRRGLPLLALVPPLAYNEWVFRASPGFRVWVSPHYADTVVSAGDWLTLLAPAAVAALSGLAAPGRPRDPQARPFVVRLWLWVAIALLIAVLRPVSFSLQFGVGIGLPLLVLAAAALARWRLALEISVPLLATNAVVYASLAATPSPQSHPPSERIGIATALREACRPGDVVLAPADIGLYVGGLTPCWPYVSHAAAPDFPARVAAVRHFYDPAASPADRALLLERACVRHVALSAGLPPEFLGRPTPFRPAFVVSGPNGAVVVWSRDGPRTCTPARDAP